MRLQRTTPVVDLSGTADEPSIAGDIEAGSASVDIADVSGDASAGMNDDDSSVPLSEPGLEVGSDDVSQLLGGQESNSEEQSEQESQSGKQGRHNSDNVDAQALPPAARRALHQFVCLHTPMMK